MNKVSIIMYSTFSGSSFKAPNLNELVHLLDKEHMLGLCHGMADKEDTRTYSSKILTQLILSKTSRLYARIVSNLYEILPISNYYAYLAGEKFNGFLAKKHINQYNDIVYIKPRPISLAKKLKEQGKKVIIEASESHPRFTKEILESEMNKFHISSKSIFTDEKAVLEFEKSLKYADHLICLSHESAKTYIDRGYPAKQIKVINLNNTVFLDKKDKVNNRKRVFVSTAYHSILKGTHRVLLAWRASNLKEEVLYIIGGIHPDLQEFINKNGPFHNVVFTGPKNKKELLEFYLNHDCIGISLSLSESFSRATLEYLASSIPVITSYVATCDIVVNGVNGYIIKYDDHDTIVSTFQLFAELSYEEYYQMCIKAYESAHTLDGKFAKELVAYFKTI